MSMSIESLLGSSQSKQQQQEAPARPAGTPFSISSLVEGSPSSPAAQAGAYHTSPQTPYPPSVKHPGYQTPPQHGYPHPHQQHPTYRPDATHHHDRYSPYAGGHYQQAPYGQPYTQQHPQQHHQPQHLQQQHPQHPPQQQLQQPYEHEWPNRIYNQKPTYYSHSGPPPITTAYDPHRHIYTTPEGRNEAHHPHHPASQHHANHHPGYPTYPTQRQSSLAPAPISTHDAQHNLRPKAPEYPQYYSQTPPQPQQEQAPFRHEHPLQGVREVSQQPLMDLMSTQPSHDREVTPTKSLAKKGKKIPSEAAVKRREKKGAKVPENPRPAPIDSGVQVLQSSIVEPADVNSLKSSVTELPEDEIVASEIDASSNISDSTQESFTIEESGEIKPLLDSGSRDIVMDNSVSSKTDPLVETRTTIPSSDTTPLNVKIPEPPIPTPMGANDETMDVDKIEPAVKQSKIEASKEKTAENPKSNGFGMDEINTLLGKTVAPTIEGKVSDMPVASTGAKVKSIDSMEEEQGEIPASTDNLQEATQDTTKPPLYPKKSSPKKKSLPAFNVRIELPSNRSASPATASMKSPGTNAPTPQTPAATSATAKTPGRPRSGSVSMLTELSPALMAALNGDGLKYRTETSSSYASAPDRPPRIEATAPSTSLPEKPTPTVVNLPEESSSTVANLPERPSPAVVNLPGRPTSRPNSSAKRTGSPVTTASGDNDTPAKRPNNNRSGSPLTSSRSTSKNEVDREPSRSTLKNEGDRERDASPALLTPSKTAQSSSIPSVVPAPAKPAGVLKPSLLKPPSIRKITSATGPPEGMKGQNRDGGSGPYGNRDRDSGTAGGSLNGFSRSGSSGSMGSYGGKRGDRGERVDRVERDEYPGLYEGVGTLRNTLKSIVDKDPDIAAALEELGSESPLKRQRLDSPAVFGTDFMKIESKNSVSGFPPSLETKFTPLNFASPPDQITFRLSIPMEYSIASPTGAPTFTKQREILSLTSCNIIRRFDFPTFAIEDCYEVQSLLPRSYYTMLHHGKMTYINVRPTQGEEMWELHIKHARERNYLFGYLVRKTEMHNLIQTRANSLLVQRRLPLVLDLDDTLVRVVGNEQGRYVPENKIGSIMHRVRKLPDGRRVVLTERVEEFLEWAQKYYEVNVCSLGDQHYVDMVIGVLDPQRTRIRGVVHSARNEFLYIESSRYPRRPPKDLLTLFPFCGMSRGMDGPDGPAVEPIVVDDNVNMWPADQQDNIIVVKEKRNADVWNVQLFPVVQQVLATIHSEFFRQLDTWDRVGPPPPGACRLYKEHLRAELGRRIAED
ncbi:RNA polymerase II [Dinochytrium kinnereticum]|nr:RNA polymerase II [Dinochytrium kinnereticum]